MIVRGSVDRGCWKARIKNPTARAFFFSIPSTVPGTMRTVLAFRRLTAEHWRVPVRGIGIPGTYSTWYVQVVVLRLHDHMSWLLLTVMIFYVCTRSIAYIWITGVLYTVHCALCSTVHCALCTMHYALCTMHEILCIVGTYHTVSSSHYIFYMYSTVVAAE